MPEQAVQAARMTVLTDGFLPHAGGSRVYYYNLFKRVAADGDAVTILTTRTKGWQQFDAAEVTPHLRIIRHLRPLRDFSFNQLPRSLGSIVVTLSQLIVRRPQLLHCGDLYPCGVVAILARRLLRLRFVAYCHGEDITLTDQRRFQPRLRDAIYARASAIIANGEFAVDNLRRIGVPEHKIHKITPGLDSSLFFPMAPPEELRSRFNLKDELVILTVARLTDRKGHARILHALAALRSELPPVRYLIVGRGHLEQPLRDLVRELKLDALVTFAGFVPDDQLNAFYNLADIVAMPNTDRAGDVEGFGMVFLEANAAGKPVIAGRSGGTSEAVADRVTGYLVSSQDDAELRDALALLLRDASLRERMGQAGLHRVRADFTWSARATRVRELSASIIAAEKPERPRQLT